MSERGTSARRTYRAVEVRTDPRFGSARGLVRWHLTAGRASFGGLKAISYERDGVPRDVFRATEGHALFALTTLCLAAVTDARQSQALALAYGADLSDLRIAERWGVSETTARRERCRGLRAVEAKARALYAVACAETGRPLLAEDDE